MKCPHCGAEITLVPKPGDPTILQGFCKIKGTKRCVIEVSNPEFPVRKIRRTKKYEYTE